MSNEKEKKEDTIYKPFDGDLPPSTYKPFNTTKDTTTEDGKTIIGGETLYKNMEDAYKAYTGFKDFSYDFNAEALYQQYKDKYVQQGKMAMADTMGQAAALTGGYGNSYAASVGNQAYQAHLNNLNDIIPELYNMALNKYNTDYSKAKDAYSAASNAYYSAADLYGTEQDSINSLAQKAYENEFNLWDANNTNAWKQAKWDESEGTTESNGKDNDDDGDVVYDGSAGDAWLDFDEDTYNKNVAENGGSYYETAYADIMAMAKAGMSTTDMMAYANAMLGNSLISRSEYTILKNKISEIEKIGVHKLVRRRGATR